VAEPPTDLADLRTRIDELDAQLIEVLAERIRVCEQVAKRKEASGASIIQPNRVREVLGTRRQWAIDQGLDPDFVEQIVRVLLAETHRIEVASGRPEPAPDKEAAPGRLASAIDTVATRIDHVVVAVENLDDAQASLSQQFGLQVERAGEHTVIATGGGVTLVLVDGGAHPIVARFLERHGPGVGHIAIDVLNAQFTHDALAANGTPLLTDVVVDADGHEEFLAAVDLVSGLQLAFISRTGHRLRLGSSNLMALLDALE
jgi:chorismate mutase-like protein